MTADALSTLVFVIGMERGLELMAAFPGTEAVLVDNRQQVYITQNLKDCYQTTEGIHVNMI